tara:strand:- start:354 stop:548 length:195 start_codon:yes stop_codon:yes gene_type:complete
MHDDYDYDDDKSLVKQVAQKRKEAEETKFPTSSSRVRDKAKKKRKKKHMMTAGVVNGLMRRKEY